MYRAGLALRSDEEVGPYHVVNDVTDTEELSFGGAIRVHLLFLSEVDDGYFSKGHAAACVAFEVRVNGKGCVDSPVDDAHVRDIEGEARIAFEVVDEAAYFGPVVFIRSLIRLERKARAVRPLRRDRVTRKRIYTTVPLNICA